MANNDDDDDDDDALADDAHVMAEIVRRATRCTAAPRETVFFISAFQGRFGVSTQCASQWPHHCRNTRLAALATVQQRIQYKICVLVVAAPSSTHLPVSTVYSSCIIHRPEPSTFSSVVSYCRTKNYGQRSFSYSGPTLWNSLPLMRFSARLKTEMFYRAYDSFVIVLPWQSRLYCCHANINFHTYTLS